MQLSYPTPEVRGGSQEELPHIQGAMAAQAQEGLEELIHVQGQEGRLWPGALSAGGHGQRAK